MNTPSAPSLFGTDGIRGRANSFPMTAELALRLGMAAGTCFTNGHHHHKAVIAKDTRLSGYMLEPALTAGLIAAGIDVFLVGPLPTPAVSMLVRSMRADLGIMLSASHNPYMDNGLKLFGPDGYKLSLETEKELERLVHHQKEVKLADASHLGRAKRLEDARGRYIELVKRTLPKHITLEGMTIVLDCANGAAYQVGPTILRELGAEVITLSCEPNGTNINAQCGSTYPATLQEKVRSAGANLGIALDGDADRVILCDEQGNLIDGDLILALIATYMKQCNRLPHYTVVSTVMANLGFEHYLKQQDITLIRTPVGDRNVVETMRSGGYTLGGEQSGHIILSQHTSTGDGLIAALQVLAVMAEQQKPLSALKLYTPMPQILQNVPYSARNPLDTPDAQHAITAAEEKLGTKGRIVVRPSGTEPLIRVMVEGENNDTITSVAHDLCETMHTLAS